jgi:curved DNA-binding protein CbpA
MSQTFLPTKWLQQLSDPYAVLGIALTADERQILNRYHVLAKLLHPDHYTRHNNLDQNLATAVFTRLINPAYDELKHIQRRANVMTALRLEAITWGQKAAAVKNPVVKKLMAMSVREAESFYPEAIASYTTDQYKSLAQSYQITQQLNELNLAYLCLHTDNSFIMEPPQAIISEVTYEPREVILDETPTLKPAVINYAQRHYQRAIEYAKQANWSLAVKELRDAIKLESNNSDYYALLGVVHLRQKFPGMARVYIRQALKINPHNSLALKYASHLKIQLCDHTHPKSLVKAIGIAGLLSKFMNNVETISSQVLKSR